jgi:hypothetical protein
LQKLPFFSWERVATRVFVSVVLCVAVLAGIGVDSLHRRFGLAGAILAALLIIAGVFDQWLVGPPNLAYAFEHQEPMFVASPGFQHIWAGPGRMLPYARANMGSLTCEDFMPPVPPAAQGCNSAGYRGEQYLDGSGSVELKEWTPNLLKYDADLSAPAALVINQRYDPSWQLIQGSGRTYAKNGLIALALPPGRQSLTLRYRSVPFVRGGIATILSLIALSGLWWFERRN